MVDWEDRVDAKGNDVPAPVEPFVGREAELDYLHQSVLAGRVLALVGDDAQAGIGRSALARAFAHSTQSFDAVYWWSIPLDGPRPHAALRRWAARSGFPVEGVSSQSDLLDTVSAVLHHVDRALILVEGVRAEDAAAVADLLTLRGDGVAVLLTCESPELAQQLGARPIVVEPLLEEEGLELLVQVVGSGVPPIIGVSILQTVSYLPLGIHLAACRIRSSSTEESTGIYGGRLDPERVAWLGGPTGVARAFLDSYRRLDEGDQMVLRATGAARYGLVAATSVAPLVDAETAVVEASLERLAVLGLVSSADGGARWLVHPLIGGFARRLADELGEGEAWRRWRLSEVISAHGEVGPDLRETDILDVIETTLAEGSTDDLVALATRVAEAVHGWCAEAAVELLARAVDAAGSESHRGVSLLRRLWSSLREADAEEEVEVELVDEGTGDDLLGLPEEGVTEVVSRAAIDEMRRRMAPGELLTRFGLHLDGDHTDPSIDVDVDAGAPAQIFDVAKLLAAVGGPSDPDTLRAQAVRAAEQATALHARATRWVVQAHMDVEETEDAEVGKAFDGLVGAARKLTGVVGRVRAASEAASDSDDASAVEAATSRAVRDLEAAEHTMGIAEAAWTVFQDAVVEGVERKAYREAAARAAGHDAVVARQVWEEARKRLRTRMDQFEVADGSAWDDLVDRLQAVEAQVDEADRIVAELSAGSQDSEDAGQVVRSLRMSVEAAAREVLSQAARRVRAGRSEQQRVNVLADANDQLERLEQDASWAESMCDELAPRVEGQDDGEAIELAGRLREIRTDVRDHRRAARDAARRLEEAPEATWLGLLERVSTSARAVTASLDDVERLRADVEQWASEHASEDPQIALAAIQADAATAMASVEATAAVARRAISRAEQASSMAASSDVAAQVEALQGRDEALRQGVESAREQLRVVVEATDLTEARQAWTSAQAAVRGAEDAATDTRTRAEKLLAAADARRRSLLRQAVDEARDLASRVRDSADQAEAMATSLREAPTDILPAEVMARVEESLGRARAASEAAMDGVRRLGSTRDPAYAERIVDAMSDAANVVAAALVEGESARAVVREAELRVADPDRRRAAVLDTLAEARRELAAAAEDVAAVTDAATGALKPVIDAALREARRDDEQAHDVLEGLPNEVELAPEVWLEEVEGRAEVVRRLVSRMRAGASSARALVDAARARQETAARSATDEAAVVLEKALASSEAVVGRMPEIGLDAMWPSPIRAIALAVRQDVDDAEGGHSALKRIDPSDGDAALDAAERLLARIEAAAERALQRRRDLDASVATWSTFQAERRATEAVAWTERLETGASELRRRAEQAGIVGDVRLAQAVVKAAAAADAVSTWTEDAEDEEAPTMVLEGAFVALREAEDAIAEILAKREGAGNVDPSGAAAIPEASDTDDFEDLLEPPPPAVLAPERPAAAPVQEPEAASEPEPSVEERIAAAVADAASARDRVQARRAMAEQALSGLSADDATLDALADLDTLVAEAEIGLAAVEAAAAADEVPDDVLASVADRCAAVLELPDRADRLLQQVHEGVRTSASSVLEDAKRAGDELAPELSRARAALASARAALATGRALGADVPGSEVVGAVSKASSSLSQIVSTIDDGVKVLANTASLSQASSAAATLRATAPSLTEAIDALDVDVSALNEWLDGVAAAHLAERAAVEGDAWDARAARAVQGADRSFLAARRCGGEADPAAYRAVVAARALLSRAVVAYETAREGGAGGRVLVTVEELAAVVVRLASDVRSATVTPDVGLDQARVAALAPLARVPGLTRKVADARTRGWKGQPSQGLASASDALGAVGTAAMAVQTATTSSTLEAAATSLADAVSAAEVAVAAITMLTPPTRAPSSSPDVFDLAAAQRGAAPGAAREAALAAVAAARDAGPADARALLRIQAARASLTAGRVDEARRALAEASVLATDAEVVALVDRLVQLAQTAGAAVVAPVAWVESAESVRRARRQLRP